MEEGNLHVKLEGDQKTLTVFTAKGLDQRLPEPLLLEKMHITTPSSYLAYRKPPVGDVVVLKDIRERKITVKVASVIGEGETGSLQNKIVGQLNVNPDLKAFHINDDSKFSIEEMKKHIKKNKRFFHSQTGYEEILKNVSKFEGKVETFVKKERDDRGNIQDVHEKKTSLNFPNDFEVKIPFFDGFDPKIFKVELGFDMTSTGKVEFFFISSELNDLIIKDTEEIIGQEISNITNLGYMILF